MPKVPLKISKPVQYAFIVFIIVAAVFAALEVKRVYNIYSWKKYTREYAEKKLAGEVTRIQRMILSIEQVPQNLAYVLEFSNPKKEHMKVLLEAVVANNDEVFGTCIAFEPNMYDKDTMYYAPYLLKRNGQLEYTDPADTTYNYFSMDWYLIPKTLKRPVWIEPYFDEGVNAANCIIASYSVPFYSYDGTKETMKGIVSVDITLEWLLKMVSSIELTNECYIMLVSENGTVLSAPYTQWAYNESLFSLADENNFPILREIGRDLQKGKSGFVNAGKWDNKRDYWIYYMPIHANNWGVLLVAPEG
jgi:phosphoserine phosphatase RsbU/P